MKTISRLPTAKASLGELLELRQQLDAWREAQTPRTPLPEELWELSAALARTHGVSRVARILGLSFYKLRQRLGTAMPAGFIELAPLAAPSAPASECLIELRDGRGGQMTLRLASAGSTLRALAADFWRRGQ